MSRRAGEAWDAYEDFKEGKEPKHPSEEWLVWRKECIRLYKVFLKAAGEEGKAKEK